MKHTLTTKAFTLIELLIVISLVGILGGILVTVINPASQRAKAEDGVRIATVEKLSQGINAFYASEGYYPRPSTDTNGNPLNNEKTGPLLAAFIKTWPSDATYTYKTDSATNVTKYTVYAPLASDTTKVAIVKYFSGWDKVQPCYSPADYNANDNCRTQPLTTRTPIPPNETITPTPTPDPKEIECGKIFCAGGEMCCNPAESICSVNGECEIVSDTGPMPMPPTR